jgi:hypothetical protein
MIFVALAECDAIISIVNKNNPTQNPMKTDSTKNLPIDSLTLIAGITSLLSTICFLSGSLLS